MEKAPSMTLLIPIALIAAIGLARLVDRLRESKPQAPQGDAEHPEDQNLPKAA